MTRSIITVIIVIIKRIMKRAYQNKALRRSTSIFKLGLYCLFFATICNVFVFMKKYDRYQSKLTQRKSVIDQGYLNRPLNMVSLPC